MLKYSNRSLRHHRTNLKYILRIVVSETRALESNFQGVISQCSVVRQVVAIIQHQEERYPARHCEE